MNSSVSVIPLHSLRKINKQLSTVKLVYYLLYDSRRSEGSRQRGNHEFFIQNVHYRIWYCLKHLQNPGKFSEYSQKDFSMIGSLLPSVCFGGYQPTTFAEQFPVPCSCVRLQYPSEHPLESKELDVVLKEGLI